MSHPVTLYVNGREHSLVVSPLAPLLDVLRDELGMRGSKEGCGTGYCGACTVLVDGAPVNSCLFLTVDADHRDVTTVEGLAAGGDAHPVQAAFVAHTALQCGFCTPGMIMSAAALLAEQPDADEETIRAALAGNLCRCTGYASIVDAVRDAGERLRSGGRSGERPGPRAAIRTRT